MVQDAAGARAVGIDVKKRAAGADDLDGNVFEEGRFADSGNAVQKGMVESINDEFLFKRESVAVNSDGYLHRFRRPGRHRKEDDSLRRRDTGQIFPPLRAILWMIRGRTFRPKEGKSNRSVIFGGLEDRGTKTLLEFGLSGEPKHAMAERLPNRGEQAFAANIVLLHNDHPELPKSPFLLAIRGIEVFIIRAELPEDLRLAIAILPELRALDFQKVVKTPGLGVPGWPPRRGRLDGWRA